MTTAYRTIGLEKVGASGGIGQITLNRPAQANAMNVEMASELGAALTAALDNPEIRAIVLTGAGKTFSPGADAQDTLDLAARAEQGEYPAEPF
ncbi:MAG: enoyl-CoA hydratase, partial [Caulobacteraceae bacterium]|nr:enoyl-CoA hydratase [Caulobacteraceae bacterium]